MALSQSPRKGSLLEFGKQTMNNAVLSIIASLHISLYILKRRAVNIEPLYMYVRA